MTEDILVGRSLPPEQMAGARARTESDNSLRARVYREGTMLAIWSALLFMVLIIVIAVSLIYTSLAPSNTASAVEGVGLLGAFCLAGMAIHMLRYVVLLVTGLFRTGELIGASRQVRLGAPRPRRPLDEPRWFVRLTTSTDVDIVVQAGLVAGILLAIVLSSPHTATPVP